MAVFGRSEEALRGQRSHVLVQRSSVGGVRVKVRDGLLEPGRDSHGTNAAPVSRKRSEREDYRRSLAALTDTINAAGPAKKCARCCHSSSRVFTSRK